MVRDSIYKRALFWDTLYISLTLNSYSRDENCFKYNKKKQFKPKMFALVNFPSVEKH